MTPINQFSDKQYTMEIIGLGYVGMSLRHWQQLPENAGAIDAAVSHTEYTTQPVASLLVTLKSGGVCPPTSNLPISSRHCSRKRMPVAPMSFNL
jgi:hypothetical protein